jgi:hypothetical protein
MQPAAEAATLLERARTQRMAARQSAERRAVAQSPHDRERLRALAGRLERARGAPPVDRLRAAATRRLDRAIGLLQTAERAGRSAVPIDYTAWRKQLAPLLIDLLACDGLGEGFARVIDAAWIAFREDGARWTPDQLAALATAFDGARADSAMDIERARGLVADLAQAGLQVQIAAFDRLADLAHDDEDH